MAYRLCCGQSECGSKLHTNHFGFSYSKLSLVFMLGVHNTVPVECGGGGALYASEHTHLFSLVPKA